MPCASNRPRPSGLAAVLLGALLLAACGGKEPPAARHPVVERAIHAAPGLSIPAQISSGETHAYVFSLEKNQLADLLIDQQGADVAASLYAPDGRRLATVDSGYGKRGPEILPILAGAAGRYRLEVVAGDSGRYEIRIPALRPALPRDRERVAAERLFSSGEELRRRDDQPSLAAAAGREQEALARFRALGERRREADVLYSLGQARLRLERNAAALEAYQSALALFRAQGREREAGRTLSYTGQVQRYLGRPREALESYRQALALNRRLGERWAEAVTLTNLGKLYGDSLGETGKALDCYEQALVLWRELGDRGKEASTLKNLGDLYQFQGEPRKALDYLEPALAIFEAEGRPRETAGLLVSIGDTRSRSGDGRKGAELLRRALAIQRRIGDRRGEALTLNDLGWVHLLLGQPREARTWFARAAPIFREVGDRPGETAVLASLAWVDAELGHPREAIESLGRILPSLAASGDRQTEAMALLALARARRAVGDLPAAGAAAEAGIARVEALRGGSASPELRTSFLASNQAFYGFYIDLLMELEAREPGAGHAARALAASEEARARGLLDLLTESRAGLRQGIAPRLLAREAEAARTVNEAEERRHKLADAGAPPARLVPAERELRLRLTRYDRVQSEIRLASPGYALAQPRPLNLGQIQLQVVDADTLLLEYALGDERSFLWAVTPDSIASFELPPRVEIEAAARRAHQLLAASRQTLARGQAGLALAELSRLLLRPAAGLLGSKRLLIVADGALHFVPFAALPVPGTAEPLVAGHEIVTSPSASSLAVLRSELSSRRPPPRTLAVVADPVFDAADPRVAHGTRRGATPSPFARLPFSREEAESILALAPRDGRLKALGFAASRETVLSGALRHYRIVHFATHGVLDAVHPELSGIVLSQVDPEGRPRDGFLRAHEIYRLSLPADLVVLSACGTALGREIHGEGLVGLTRGFQYAGARGVLVSLWEVEDRATAELMRLFYREVLRRGRTPAAALRAAQLSLQEEPGWQAPYYWAGFVLQGDWRPSDKPFRPPGIYPGDRHEQPLQRRNR
jgi:CHAT domain-containing protein/tetratricopeptide (TPR) repeat protein